MTSTFSTIGIILLALGLIIFGYQGLSAFIGMGASDEFVYENISFADILDEDSIGWIDNISSTSIASIAEILVYAPIALWMMGGALLCFIIHAFRGTKHIK